MKKSITPTKITNSLDIELRVLHKTSGVKWVDMDVSTIGYANPAYATIIARMLRVKAFDLTFLCGYLVLHKAKSVETKYVKIECYTPPVVDPVAYTTACGLIKRKIAQSKPKSTNWKLLSAGAGYREQSGTLSRSMRTNNWLPIELAVFLMKEFGLEKVEAEHEGHKVVLTVFKT
jgi:hypothetical protein